MRIPPFVINEPIPKEIKDKMNEEYFIEFEKIAKEKKNNFANTKLTSEERQKPLHSIQGILLGRVQEQIKRKYHYYDYVDKNK